MARVTLGVCWMECSSCRRTLDSSFQREWSQGGELWRFDSPAASLAILKILWQGIMRRGHDEVTIEEQ